jgi:hypothetical protein
LPASARIGGAESTGELRFTNAVEKHLRGSRREMEPLPVFSEYMRLIDEAVSRESLSSDNRVVARAFAIAVYRRAIANRVMSDVRILASEAVAAVVERIGERKESDVRKLTYEYNSASRKRISERKPHNERKKRYGEGR